MMMLNGTEVDPMMTHGVITRRVMQLLALYQALIDENKAYYKQEGIL